MSKKIIKYGFGTLLNEEMDVEGWAKTLNFFCDKVVALVDDETTDDTEKILKEKCPWVEIQYQDKTLGDSSDLHEGPEHKLYMHDNQTRFVKENIEEGTWFFALAGDERFSADQFNLLYNEVKYAMKNGYDRLSHLYLHEPVPADHHQLKRGPRRMQIDLNIPKKESDVPLNFVIDYYLKWGFAQPRFMQNNNWEHCSKPHSGYTLPLNPLFSNIPLYHFHKIKFDVFSKTTWRDRVTQEFIDDNKRLMPVFPMLIPFDDWKTMPEIDRLHGPFVYAKEFKVLKKWNVENIKKQVTFLQKKEEDRLEYLEDEKKKKEMERHAYDMERRSYLLTQLTETKKAFNDSKNIIKSIHQKQRDEIDESKKLFDLLEKQIDERVVFINNIDGKFKLKIFDIEKELDAIQWSIKQREEEKNEKKI